MSVAGGRLARMEITTVLVTIVALFAGAAIGYLFSMTKSSALKGAKELLEARVATLEAEKAASSEEEKAFIKEFEPIKALVGEMNKGLEGLKTATNTNFGTITESLKNADERNSKIDQTTSALKNLLGHNQERGAWGEVQLENLLNASGLQAGRDYLKQTVLENEEGQVIKPDYIVRYPNKRFVVIDAKFPFSYFEQAMAIVDTTSAREAERRKELLDEHIKAVKKHIDDIKKKTYYTGFDDAKDLSESPEMTLMFFPIESVYSNTLSHDPSLYEYAIQRQVQLVSPMQLFGALRTINYMWRHQAQESSVREIIQLGTQLFERLKVVAGHVESVGKSLNSSVKHFNSLVGSIESNLLTTTRKLTEEGLKLGRSGEIDDPNTVDSQARQFTKPELTSDQKALEADE